MAYRQPRKCSLPHPSDGGLDCTSKCQLPAHADLAISCAALGNLDLLHHCKTVCANYSKIRLAAIATKVCVMLARAAGISSRDVAGRTVLHVAASCGHHELVDWLLHRRKAQIDVMDKESSWTSLPRSA